MTGLKLKEHLRASPIEPWRDATDAERLDGYNGLLLAPHVDHPFDKGFLSFDDQGRIPVSPRLDPVVLLARNIEGNAPIGRFSPEQSSNLGYRRTYAFQLKDELEAR